MFSYGKPLRSRHFGSLWSPCEEASPPSRSSKSWTTRDVDDTVLAVCVDGPTRGSFQQSCLYESSLSPYGATKVDFYASKFKIKAYEVRTGERVVSYTTEIGDPCPPILTYETYGVDIGPPDKVESDYTSTAVRSMFHRLVD